MEQRTGGDYIFGLPSNKVLDRLNEQLASDRSGCRSALANQIRPVLHTGACWLMLRLLDAIPAPQPLARAEFIILRMRVIRFDSRIVETVSRVRIAIAAAHPEAALFANLACCTQPAGP